MSQVTEPTSAPDGSRPEVAPGTRRLLTAAVAAFAAKGFHGTTTRDIASAAGMSPAALYVHHRSKEDLLHAISLEGHQRTLAEIDAAAAGAVSDGAVARMRAVMAAFTAHHARNHTTARIVNYELAALSAEHHAEVMAIRHQIEDRIRSLVEQGVAAGDFSSANPRMTALALLSLGVDVARWYRDDGDWSPEDVGEHYAELALRILGASVEP